MYKECPLVPENSTVLLLRSHIRDLTTWAPCFAMQITYTFGSEFKEKKKERQPGGVRTGLPGEEVLSSLGWD